MKLRSKKVPIIIIAIGLVLSLIAYLCTAVKMKPTITEHGFDYSVTYMLNGETYTLEDVFTVTFEGFGRDSNPTSRYYDGEYMTDDGVYPSGSFNIEEKDGYELRIVTIFSEDYLMGDGDKYYTNMIYLAAYDDMGSEYSDPETLSIFDAEIISYELPTPIENSYTFAGFSIIHDLTVGIMLAIALLVLFACIILVRRSEGVKYKALDIISIIFNVIIGVAVIPFITVIAYFSQIYLSVYELSYLFNLFIPLIGAYSLIASLCLRRKGYRKSGFFIQFVGPALFALSILIESIIY